MVISAGEPDLHGLYGFQRTALRSSGIYTLYRNDRSHPFIHALDATNRQAIWIDLPWHGSQDGIWRLRLRLSTDEAALRVTRRGKPFATIDRSTHQLLTGRG